MKSSRPPLFWKRKFEPQVIVTCVRWYLRFCLRLRDLEELMAERGLAVDYTSIWRWIQAYGPEIRRMHGAVKAKSATWHMDETFIRGRRQVDVPVQAVDAHGQTGRFLPVRDARPRGGQDLPQKGFGQFRQSASARVGPRWTTELSGGDSRIEGRGSRRAALSSANPALLQ